MVSVVPIRVVQDRTSLDSFNYPSCPPDYSTPSLASSKVSMRASPSSVYLHGSASSPLPTSVVATSTTHLSPRRAPPRPKHHKDTPQSIHPGQNLSPHHDSQSASFSTESLKKTLSSITPTSCSTPPPPSIANVSYTQYPSTINNNNTSSINNNNSPKSEYSKKTRKDDSRTSRRNISPPQHSASNQHGNSHKTKGATTNSSAGTLSSISKSTPKLDASSSPAPKSRRQQQEPGWDMPDNLLKPKEMEQLTWQQIGLTRVSSPRSNTTNGSRNNSSKVDRSADFFDGPNPFYVHNNSGETATEKPRHKRASSLRNAPTSMSSLSASSFPVAGDVFFNTPKTKNDDLHLPHSAGNQGRRKAGANHVAAVGYPKLGGGVDNLTKRAGPKDDAKEIDNVTLYAGAKFQNSPAPTALPKPMFLSLSRQ